MKNISLFTKILLPVVFFGILVSFVSVQYINSVVKDNINFEINEKIKTKSDHIEDYIISEFKLLFYIYGTSSENFTIQEAISKKDTINILRKSVNNTPDIVYIVTPNEYIQISSNSINNAKIDKLIQENSKEFTHNSIKYVVLTTYFKPWDWKIVYLLDITTFESIILKNQLYIFIAIFLVLFVIVLTLFIVFYKFVQKPTKTLLRHFENVSKGNYDFIEKEYHSKEIDLMISYVNKMTRAIETRELESKKLLDETLDKEKYIKDILDSQSNIIVVNDFVNIQAVNKSFFKLFKNFKTLDEFREQHRCVCEFFIKEEGFIYDFPEQSWIEYIIQRPNVLHKAKIKLENTYHIFALEVVKSSIFDRIIVSMTNITELEKSNSLLEEYKKAVDASAIVSKTDSKGRITYVNDRFVDISGYQKEELLGKNHNIIRSPRVSPEVFAKMWRTIKSKNIWSGELENISKSGKPYYVASTIVPILDSNDDITEYLALRYDITEQVEAKKMALKAEQAKSLFLANMSHEIRTPLNAIIGFTKILNSMKLADKASNYIKIIDQSAQNLLGIINDILDISKIESGNISLDKKEFNFFSELDGVINLFNIKANEKSINLISFIDPKIPQFVIGDTLRLKQIFSNLISNAIKFTSEGGFVSVRIELVSLMRDICKVRFEIKDSGIGISDTPFTICF